jgi:hypothetical protein
MSEPHVDDASSIDYSLLRTNIKNDRWSPLASVFYAVTAVVIVLNLMIINALFSDNSALIAFLVVSVASVILVLISRIFFLRVNPAKTEDLLAFASTNSMSTHANPPATYLNTLVRIILRYSMLYPAYDWRYQIELWMNGNYKSYPIAFYNLSFDTPITTDSDIEHGMLDAYYKTQDAQTSITLTIYQRDEGMLAARKVGLVLWTLPNLSPETMKKIRRVTKWYVGDVQTNGTQLAILLPATLPYERSGMKKLYRLLDRIYTATTSTK